MKSVKFEISFEVLNPDLAEWTKRVFIDFLYHAFERTKDYIENYNIKSKIEG